MFFLLEREVGVDEYRLSCRKYKLIPYLIIEITLLMVNVWKKKMHRGKKKQNSNPYSTLLAGVFLLVVLLCF